MMHAAEGGAGRPLLTAYDWAPDEGRGLVRDMRVRWALEEVGQPYDVRYLHWGEQKTPEHRRRNPFGQVPSLATDGVEQFESGSIVLNIASSWPGLLPDDPAARRHAIDWIFAALNTIEPVVWDLVMARILERGEPWYEQRLPSVRRRLDVRLRELADYLGDADWLVSDFSAADLLMVQVLRHADAGGALGDHPVLAAYVARGMARPAFARALAALRAGQTGQRPANWPPTKGEST